LRKVILHYHLFKNAGTSLDAAFKENFSEEKGEWVTKEFPNQPAANREQVRQWILDNPQAKCFSSHTALFPVPEFDDIEVFPVIFIRHPLDRIASAYTFEAKQKVDTFGSVLARNTSLEGYISVRLSLTQDRQCRNYHTFRLATCTQKSQEAELLSALTTMESLPFVGLVEQYNQSTERLNIALNKSGFKNINLKPQQKNQSSNSSIGLQDKIESLQKKLSPIVFSKLLEANENDSKIYEYVKEKYAI